MANPVEDKWVVSAVFFEELLAALDAPPVILDAPPVINEALAKARAEADVLVERR